MGVATTFEKPRLPGLQRSKSTAVVDRTGAEGRPRARCAREQDRLPPLRSKSECSAHSRPAGSLQHTPSMFAAQGSAAANAEPADGPSSMSQCCAPSSPGLAGGLAGAATLAAEGATSPQRLAELCRSVASLAVGAQHAERTADGCVAADGASGCPATPRLLAAQENGSEEVQALQGSLTARCASAAQEWQSLEDFSSLRMIASGKGSTVWEATPRAAAGPPPSGCPPRGSVVVKACCSAQLGRRALQRLLLEQRILKTVRHPHIIRGLASFQQDGHTFLVMAYADGRSVPQFISYWRRRNKEDFEGASTTTLVPEAGAAQLVLAPLLDALEHLHSLGIVHRDVKASNLAFTRGGCLKLLDFGLSLDTRSGEELPCCQIGSLAHMAPELLGAEPPSVALVDRTDVWAVGVLAFQLLTGQLPWYHEVPALLQHLVAEAAVPWQLLDVMGASTGAQHFIRQALTKDPAQRPTALQLRAHPWLLQHAGGQPLEPSRFAA
ncbi:hypothetical protein ABPG75_012607 [Micractinium tetrahymenae]